MIAENHDPHADYLALQAARAWPLFTNAFLQPVLDEAIELIVSKNTTAGIRVLGAQFYSDLVRVYARALTAKERKLLLSKLFHASLYQTDPRIAAAVATLARDD